ncbi:MAG: rod-binding protein [Pirellulales bacterium]
MSIFSTSSAANGASPWQMASKPAAEAVERYRDVNRQLKQTAAAGASSTGETAGAADQKGELREAFNSFVGESLFGQMLAQMRKTVGKPAYFHGGQAEELFRGQLDQVLAQEMTKSSGHSFSDRLFEQQFMHEWTA